MVQGRFGGCRCDDENRNKEIERVARLDRRQWRSRVAALIVCMTSASTVHWQNCVRREITISSMIEKSESGR